MDTLQDLHGGSVRLPMDTTRLTWRFCPSFHDKTYVDFLSYGETITLNAAVVSVCLCVDRQHLHGAVVSVCLCVDRQHLHGAVVSVCLCVDRQHLHGAVVSVCLCVDNT